MRRCIDFSDFRPQNPSIFGLIFEAFSRPTRKTRFCKNRAPACTGARFLRFRTCKKRMDFNKKRLKMRVPKKNQKNDSKNRFSEPCWLPKPLQNGPKIDKHPRRKKKRKNYSESLKKKPVLASEREARYLPRCFTTR